MALPKPNKESDSIVVVKGLTKHFSVGRGLFRREQARLHAVDDVSFDVARGEVFGLVGESGCGKTTTGRMLVKLTVPTSGDIFVDNEDISAISGQGMREFRQRVQMIFQDPYESLDPRMTVFDIISEPPNVNQIGNLEER